MTPPYAPPGLYKVKPSARGMMCGLPAKQTPEQSYEFIWERGDDDDNDDDDDHDDDDDDDDDDDHDDHDDDDDDDDNEASSATKLPLPITIITSLQSLITSNSHYHYFTTSPSLPLGDHVAQTEVHKSMNLCYTQFLHSRFRNDLLNYYITNVI